ncbi:hypothetical protein [Salisediminibacterium selenitireducens]|uniref:YtxH domain-containing protein n=1 Tax=Bacillus selenitireducens (strain ATCC 700615 / DSM 15326 / MLS10) TaxID=439292 RepID=D6XYJ4_BACIE|nr:hypothetical protein [Salisediminibacterium selenitireducens]ADI00263.1 hypothetical protein Bsel_2771 [[Bacillus] selenitireducens MLS10]
MSSRKWIVAGAVAAAVAGGAYVASNPSARSKVTDTVGTTKHWVQVINENRDDVVEQLSASAEKVQGIVESAVKDVEQITEGTQNMKGHLFDLLETVQDAMDELKVVKNKLETGANERQLLEEATEDE